MTPDMLIGVLAWVAVGLGSLVLALLSWFAVRIVRQLDTVTGLLQQQHNDFREEIHKHELRLVQLESWQRGIDRRQPPVATP